MFGSFFGDAVTVIGKTFFNVDIAIPALWFTPLNEPMRLLLFSFLIGVIHLFAGLGAQFYQLARQGLWKDAIFDVVFWYMLVGGGILYLLSMQMFADMVSLGFTLPAAVGTAGAIAAGIGAVGIVLTAGRESEARSIAFEGPVRPVRRVELSERHPLLFETARARPCDGRHRLGLQPDGRDARQQPGGRRRIRVRVPRRGTR